ncbi:hypothetical protein [Hoylesella buccalis]|uniref:hypothetical protein n=1 Tax=Hoylesella buccalis TaxID=28127 RepID=UPI002889D44F|nr:hypothetical protein [Hoylesella buccalis]
MKQEKMKVLLYLKLKSVIRISFCRTTQRNPNDRFGLKGYEPLYPLSVIIVLSIQLDSTEAYLFRRYLFHKIQQPLTSITPIFLFGGMHH